MEEVVCLDQNQEKLLYSATIYDGFGHPASKRGLCFGIVGTSETLRFRVMNVVFDSSKYSREHVAFYDMADNAFSVVHQFNGNPNVTSRIVACDYQIEVENNKKIQVNGIMNLLCLNILLE